LQHSVATAANVIWAFSRRHFPVIFNEKQVHHQLDDIARGEVLAGCFVGYFGEFADQFLKGQAHVVVADDVGAEVEAGEFFSDLLEYP
jgi:hypothetical protein